MANRRDTNLIHPFLEPVESNIGNAAER